jgi:hypothetical protein
MSEFIELHDIEQEGAPLVVLVNLDQVGSIYKQRDGSVIWFFEHPDNKGAGRIHVRESHAEILSLRRKAREADRT